MKSILSNKRGVAGLEILLGTVVMLFMIGFIIMIFAMIGGELEQETFKTITVNLTEVSTQGAVNETGTFLNSSLTLIYNNASFPECSLSITQCANNSGDAPGLLIGNWSTTGCVFKYAGAIADGLNNTAWQGCNGSLSYTGNTTASIAIKDTSASLSETTDWFGIIIVITAMVVLILLTTIIIRAIKGSGMTTVGGSSGSRESA